MADKKSEILEIFKRKPGEEFSTTVIVQNVFPEEFTRLNKILEDKYTEGLKRKKAKRELAKLHRNVLYYLNSLSDEGLIKETKTGVKNEKFFALNLESAESSQAFEDIKVPIVPIEGYTEKGIIYRLDGAGWAERVNCVLIEGNVVENLHELSKIIVIALSGVNDVVGINDFESQISKDTIIFLRKLNNKCSDYSKKVSLIIDFTNLVSSGDLLRLIPEILKLENLNLIFDVQPREFQDNNIFFEEAIKIYQKNGKEMYFKNQGIHKAPYILGRSGPYTFSEREWADYKREIYGKLKGIVIGQSTVMVDVDSFISEPKFNSEEFKRLMKKISESFLIINSIQRRKIENQFNSFIRYESSPKEIMFLGKNYIRFWNYGWKRKNLNQEMLIDILRDAKDLINSFCAFEETIYKSCGMPIRFRNVFSCAAIEFIKTFFSKPKYMQFQIDSLKDFYNPDVKEILRTKERLFEVFEGGDLISFYKKGGYNPEDIMREISFVLNTYKIPFFRFSFLQPEEEQTLLKFI